MISITDDWDFYFLRVDDLPASMFVDLGAIQEAPQANLPFRAYIRLMMKSPREDGLSSQAEFDTLMALEDRIKACLDDGETVYVGRCTTNSCRDFFFYLSYPDRWAGRVDACMSAYPDYRYETGTREDAGWSCYFEYLYPRDIDIQAIQNRRVCEALKQHGDPLQAPREIDHWAFFPDQCSQDAFVAGAQGMGFALRSAYGPDGEELRYQAQVWRTDVPSFEAIDSITQPLFDLAARHGGEYDGWESEVVA